MMFDKQEAELTDPGHIVGHYDEVHAATLITTASLLQELAPGSCPGCTAYVTGMLVQRAMALFTLANCAAMQAGGIDADPAEIARMLIKDLSTWATDLDECAKLVAPPGFTGAQVVAMLLQRDRDAPTH